MSSSSLFYLLLLILSLLQLLNSISSLSTTTTTTTPQFSFKSISFRFETQQEKDEYLNNQYFRNVVPTGIKLNSRGEIFVSFPRWKPHVPYTLAKFNPDTNLFDPYPSFSLSNGKTAGNESLKSVLGFEIDPLTDWMYILDQGTLDGQNNMKLLIWDMAKNQSVASYHFQDGTEVHADNSFLNDIVVDSEKQILYISDSGKPVEQKEDSKLKPAIIRVKLNPRKEDPQQEDSPLVIDEENIEVQRFLDSHDSVMPNTNYTMKCDHCASVTPTGIDGIALSCDFKHLYWTPMTSSKLYAIDTIYFDYPQYVSEMVAHLGDKGSASDGFICSNKENLFMTMLESNNVVSFDENLTYEALLNVLDKREHVPDLSVVSKDDKLQWPDTLAFDTQGNLWALSNNLGKFLSGDMDFDSDDNFFIYKWHQGQSSYITGCENRGLRIGLAELLVMTSGGGMYVFGIVTVLVITWVLLFFRKMRKKEARYFADDE